MSSFVRSIAAPIAKVAHHPSINGHKLNCVFFYYNDAQHMNTRFQNDSAMYPNACVDAASATTGPGTASGHTSFVGRRPWSRKWTKITPAPGAHPGDPRCFFSNPKFIFGCGSEGGKGGKGGGEGVGLGAETKQWDTSHWTARRPPPTSDLSCRSPKMERGEWGKLPATIEAAGRRGKGWSTEAIHRTPRECRYELADR